MKAQSARSCDWSAERSRRTEARPIHKEALGADCLSVSTTSRSLFREGKAGSMGRLRPWPRESLQRRSHQIANGDMGSIAMDATTRIG